MVKLFMVLIGCKPAGRHTEQHDIFFGIAASLKELIPAIIAFWPEADDLHIDGYREVTKVDGYRIGINETVPSSEYLFFINLGGYKENEMEEFHYKMLATGKDKNEALRKAKATAFFKHTGFKGATAHIDDKYGVDVDDMALVEEILPATVREQYRLTLTPAPQEMAEDVLHLGYFKLSDLLA
ncbi:DUF1543 domain-containing protein [Chitinophaga niabensis]|nr:DUF1543 domain-containing protein [Chitinophaga niabensis]